MYIETVNDDVKKMYSLFDEMDEKDKYQVGIILFTEWYRGQINDKNTQNPYLSEDDVIVFTIEDVEIDSILVEAIIKELFLYINEKKQTLINYDNIENELELTTRVKLWLSYFRGLDYNSKLDTLSEFVIRYNQLMIDSTQKNKITFPDEYSIAQKIRAFHITKN